MTKIFAETLTHRGSKLGITLITGDDPGQRRLAKAMFELSRDGDRDTHFDPDIHTLDVIAAGIPGHAPLACREIVEADLPAEHADRVLEVPTFRDAWEDTGTQIITNMPKARDIHMAEIRRKRNIALIEKDIEWIRGSTEQRIVVDAEKQILRDLPVTFDLEIYMTPESLKAAWPSELPIRSLGQP